MCISVFYHSYVQFSSKNQQRFIMLSKYLVHNSDADYEVKKYCFLPYMTTKNVNYVQTPLNITICHLNPPCSEAPATDFNKRPSKNDPYM